MRWRALELSRAALPAALSIALAVGAGCAGTKGSGEPEVETRALRPFSVLAIADALVVEIDTGDPGVTISGDAELVAAVAVREVRNGVTITVTDDDVLVPDLPLRITVRTPVLTQLDVTEASFVSAKNLSAPRLDVSARLGSRVVLQGTTSTLALSASGLAFVDASNLAAEDARIQGVGSASMTVFVTDQVDGLLTENSELLVLGGGRFDNLEVSRDGKVRAGP